MTSALEAVGAIAVLGIGAAVAMDIYDEVRNKDPVKRSKKHKKNRKMVEDLDDYTKKMIWG